MPGRVDPDYLAFADAAAVAAGCIAHRPASRLAGSDGSETAVPY